MISIVLLLPFFFNNLYCMNCIYNVVVVVVVVENKFQFNSIILYITVRAVEAIGKLRPNIACKWFVKDSNLLL